MTASDIEAVIAVSKFFVMDKDSDDCDNEAFRIIFMKLRYALGSPLSPLDIRKFQSSFQGRKALSSVLFNRKKSNNQAVLHDLKSSKVEFRKQKSLNLALQMQK